MPRNLINSPLDVTSTPESMMTFIVIEDLDNEDLRTAFLCAVEVFEEADQAQDDPEWHSICQGELLCYRVEADFRGIQLVTLH